MTKERVSILAQIKEVIENGGNINEIRYDYGRTPLHIAALHGDLELVRSSVSMGANINAMDDRSKTALDLAKKQGHSEIEKYLIINGANDPSNEDLHIATISANLEAIKLLFKNHKDINIDQKNAAGYTALHLAVYHGHLNIVKTLLLKRASINKETNDRETVLHIAVKSYNKDMISFLCEKGALIDHQNIKGNTALHLALIRRNTEYAKALLEKGANINISNNKGKTALDIITESGDTDLTSLITHLKDTATISTELLSESTEKDYTEIKAVKTTEETLKTEEEIIADIFMAVETKIFKVKKTLKELTQEQIGPVITAIDNDTGNSLLHIAAQDNMYDVCDILIKKGANVNLANYNDLTPLDLTDKNNKKITQLLSKNGGERTISSALMDEKSQQGRKLSPLHKALVCKDLRKAKLLIEQGADVKGTYVGGLNTLHLALFCKKPEMIVNMLLKRGADVNQKEDAFGITPLHIAVQENQLSEDILLLLLENGVNIDEEDVSGLTPLHIAAKKEYLELILLLLKHGSDAKKTIKSGYSTFDIAIHYGHKLELLDLLSKNGSFPIKTKQMLFLRIAEAIIREDFEEARSLLKYLNIDINLNEPISDGTLLFVAIGSQNIELVKLLLEKGAIITKSEISLALTIDDPKLIELLGAKSRALLIEAITNQNLEQVKTLIETGANVNMEDDHGDSLLYIASKKNANLELVELLLETGAIISEREISLAIANNNLKLVELFLERGAIITKDEMSLAIVKNDLELIELLLEKGTFSNKEEVVFCELASAIFNRNFAIFTLLLKYTGDVNWNGSRGDVTLLYIATKSQNEKIVKSLLDAGAKVTKSEISLAIAIGNKGLIELLGAQSSALLLEAVTNQYLERIEPLIQSGADVNMQDSEGNSLLHIAAKNGNLEIVVTLLRHGASTDLRNNEGHLAKHVALTYNNEVIAQILNSPTDNPCIVNYVHDITYDQGDPYSLYYRSNKDITKEEGKNTYFYKTIYHYDLKIGHPDEKLQNQLNYYVETGIVFATLQEAVNRGEVILRTEQELQGSMFIDLLDTRNMVNESEHNQNNITDSGDYSLDFSGIIHSAIIAKIQTLFFDSSY